MKEKLIIFGLGSAAEVAAYYFINDSEYEVCAFCVDAKFNNGNKFFMDRPVVDFEGVEKEYPPEEYSFFVSIGYSDMNATRTHKYKLAKKKGYNLASYFSSKASIFIDTTGLENCFVLENCTIQPYVKLADNVTIWSGTHVGHHSRIGENTFISSHIVISGSVNVGKNCFIGVNATVFQNLNIGDFSLVAGGALINEDTEVNGIYVGVPAKKLSKKSREIVI